MTPLEIVDYKAQWLKHAHVVKTHSDWDWSAKRWCKQNLKQHQWHFSKYTDVYEDTFFFETKEMKDNFEKSIEHNFE
jgi:hypothetical protein